MVRTDCKYWKYRFGRKGYCKEGHINCRPHTCTLYKRSEEDGSQMIKNSNELNLKYFDDIHCVLEFGNKNIAINTDGIFVNGKAVHKWDETIGGKRYVDMPNM